MPAVGNHELERAMDELELDELEAEEEESPEQETDEEIAELLEQVNAKLAEAEPRLAVLEARVRKLRAMRSALMDEAEDASAHFRAPGVLADRVSPEMRRRMSVRPARRDPGTRRLTGHALRSVLADVMPEAAAQQPIGSGSILALLDNKGYTATKSSLRAALIDFEREGAVRQLGEGSGTRYVWEDGTTSEE